MHTKHFFSHSGRLAAVSKTVVEPFTSDAEGLIVPLTSNSYYSVLDMKLKHKTFCKEKETDYTVLGMFSHTCMHYMCFL